MNPSENFVVCLYSEVNSLALSVLENLLASNCIVNIFTDDVPLWQESTSHISLKSRFGIFDLKNFNSKTYYSYIIYSAGFASSLNNTAFNKFMLSKFSIDSKVFILLPKELYGLLPSGSLTGAENVGIIYLGDLFGPRLSLGSQLKATSLVVEAVSKKSITVSVGDTFYPIFVSDAAKQIVKWLFAFGPYGKETLLVGPEVSVNFLWQAVRKQLGDVQLITNDSSSKTALPQGVEVTKLERNIDYILKETFSWIFAHPQEVKIKVRKEKPVKKVTLPTVRLPKVDFGFNKNNKIKTKKTKFAFKFIAFALVFPFITSLLGVVLMYLSYLSFRPGYDNLSLGFLQATRVVVSAGYYESTLLKHVPLFGQIYNETQYLSFLISKTSTIATEVLPNIRSVGELVNGILGKTVYSISDVLSGKSVSLQKISKDISSLEERTLSQKQDGSVLASYTLSKVNFERYKNLASQMSLMVLKLPEMLGEKESKTYLVLFQNNMELRPTGGFIGSYGLLTFDSGRLSDFTISDIYSADGQLNGHVEPPSPIREYLGEANWWFRDSNWDPDFPTSARRAEWFLDKEMDKQVDGVVAIDLEPIKDFLGLNGSIFLNDYNMDLTQENLYEKVQSEVESDFFPGTHRKASFLTALSRSILNDVSSLDSSKKVSLVRLFYTSLNERHVQVFVHDGDFQNSLNQLSWDGSVYISGCDSPCFSDLVGIVEANVGVNKSNYFINRQALLDINIDGQSIEKRLTLTIENSANISLGPSGRYKNYIRLLLPENASEITATASLGQSSQELKTEIVNVKGRKEVGVLVEVLGGETKEITFTWRNETRGPLTDYNLLVRKQAGVDGYPLWVKVSTPSKIFGASPLFTLTDQGSYIYNTTLTSDLFARLSL